MPRELRPCNRFGHLGSGGAGLLGLLPALKIKDVLQLEMRKARLSEDTLPTSVLMYDPFVPMKDYTLGTTTFVQYSARDLDHRWTRYQDGVTGFFGTFYLSLK